MSIIACQIVKGGFKIAADSIEVHGYTQAKGKNTTFSKMFEINDLTVGSSGYMEEISLFRIFAKTHRPSEATEESMLEFLSEFSDWKSKKMDNNKIENSYLIGINYKIFLVEEWLIQTVKTYAAIGAGSDFALAALYLGHSVKKAVKTAIELSIFCEPPIQVIERLDNS